MQMRKLRHETKVKATQLVSSKGRIWMQMAWLQSLHLTTVILLSACNTKASHVCSPMGMGKYIPPLKNTVLTFF